MALTLVPEHLARPGYRFLFLGPNQGGECDGCPVQGLCFNNLRPGHPYEVTAVRDVRHPCALHDEGRVLVCEVRSTTFPSSVKTGRLRGTAVPWEPVPCGMPECPQYGFCHPVGPERDAKMEIVEVGDTLECPAGFDLKRVALRPMD